MYKVMPPITVPVDDRIGAERTAYALALALMEQGVEPRSAIKEAGHEMGIPWGAEMGDFVARAEAWLYGTQATA